MESTENGEKKEDVAARLRIASFTDS